MTRSPVRLDDPRTFWDKVLIGDGCWEWQRARNNAGYGRLTIDNRSLYAHRTAWTLWNGRQPTVQVLHRCDNPPCCRPDHLFDGDQSINIQDAVAKGRHRGGLAHTVNPLPTHCAKGHPYREPYPSDIVTGRRRCIICANASLRTRRHRTVDPPAEEQAP